jgi:nucleoid-associated protein YgaU
MAKLGGLRAKLRGPGSLVALALLLSVAGCSGDNESEPVQNDAVTADNDGAPPDVKPDEQAEAQPASEDQNATELEQVQQEEEAAAQKQEAAEAQSDQNAEDAPPAEMVDQDSNTVKAQLDNAAPETASMPAENETPAEAAADQETNTPSGQPQTMAADLNSNANANAAQPAMAPPGTVASPGAAMFIKGTHEKNMASHHKGHHHQHMAKGGKGDGMYVVESGDTLAGISEKVYGTAHHWRSLAELNGLSAPYMIHPGDEIKFDDSLTKTVAGEGSGKMMTVVVEHGDTLGGIAERVLGSRHAWKQLMSYNKGKITDPNRIYAGMRLSYVDNGKATADAPEAQPMKTAKSHKKAKPMTAKVSGKSSVKKVMGKKADKPPISAEDFGE